MEQNQTKPTKKWCNQFLKKTSTYKKSTFPHHTGKMAERTKITDETGVVWAYHPSAWEQRSIPGANPDDCYTWLGAYHRQGYGLFSVCKGNEKSNNMTVARFGKAKALGRPLTKDEIVYSTCNNPACSNPLHLMIGTKDEVLAVTSSRLKAKRYTNEFYVQNKEFIMNASYSDIREKFNLTKIQAYNLRGMAKERIARDKL